MEMVTGIITSTRSNIRFLALGLGLCVFACAVTQPSQSPPRNQAEFVRDVADRISQSSRTKVEVEGPLSLRVLKPDGEYLLTANLDRIWSACERIPERCAIFVDEYVGGISSFLVERSGPAEKETLRITVRLRSYLETIKKRDGARAPVILPFVGDLAFALVVDSARSIRSAQRQDLEELKLSEDEAFELAKNNLRTRELKPLETVLKPITGQTIGLLQENAYESSRLVLHEDWKPYATSRGGDLIVAVPATDILVYGSGATPLAVDVLRTFALNLATKSPRPLSPLVLRWKPDGWEVLP
jgi:uncharacterized protein YtpQ (UPF0354 family)